MTAREQFAADLATWVLYVLVAWALARFAVGVIRGAATEWRWQRRADRRLAAVIADPSRYCALGHFHLAPLEVWECEAAHGIGDQ